MSGCSELSEDFSHNEGDLTEMERFRIDQRTWRKRFEAFMSRKYQKFTTEINMKLESFLSSSDRIVVSPEKADNMSKVISEIREDFAYQLSEFDRRIRGLSLSLQNQIRNINDDIATLGSNFDVLSRNFVSEIQSVRSYINGNMCSSGNLSRTTGNLHFNQSCSSPSRASVGSDSSFLRPLIKKDIFSYIWDGNIKGVEYVLNKDPSCVNSRKGVTNSTALMVAAVKGNLDICKLLVSNGAQVNERDKSGRTALILSASPWCPVSLSKFLIESGADINIRAENGETVLSCARNCCKQELVDFLEALGAHD